MNPSAAHFAYSYTGPIYWGIGSVPGVPDAPVRQQRGPPRAVVQTILRPPHGPV
jgi:hypothetical protein